MRKTFSKRVRVRSAIGAALLPTSILLFITILDTNSTVCPGRREKAGPVSEHGAEDHTHVYVELGHRVETTKVEMFPTTPTTHVVAGMQPRKEMTKRSPVLLEEALGWAVAFFGVAGYRDARARLHRPSPKAKELFWRKSRAAEEVQLYRSWDFIPLPSPWGCQGRPSRPPPLLLP